MITITIQCTDEMEIALKQQNPEKAKEHLQEILEESAEIMAAQYIYGLHDDEQDEHFGTLVMQIGFKAPDDESIH